MKVMILHNKYVWPGGEDEVCNAESDLLRSYGHDVFEFTTNNEDIVKHGRTAVAVALWSGAWSRKSWQKVQEKVKEFKPDIAHVHNFWFGLSASVFAACHDCGVPVVVTLHNYRLICPGALLMTRNGRVCEACVGRSPWRGAIKRCYHDSFYASLAAARMIAKNRKLDTWNRHVDLFIALSGFCRDMFVRGGFPNDRIVIKPNFIRDPLNGAFTKTQPDTLGIHTDVVFVGRLSREKGIHTLIKAWRGIKNRSFRLKIIGDGPLRRELEAASAGMNVNFVGHLHPDEVKREIAAAALLVLPSEWYETFGRVVVEAYACGRSVLVSMAGGPAELVEDRVTGLLFEPGNAKELCEKIIVMLSDRERLENMGSNARRLYLERYTAEKNLELLIQYYGQAIENRKACLQKS